MRCKRGVSLEGLLRCMTPVLIAGETIYGEHGAEFVITCHKKGIHSPGSKHYCGKALDLRTRDFKKKDLEKVVKEIRTLLGISFTVILEKDHIHVQYDY